MVLNIQWFPGHMAKAKREIEEDVQRVDIVFELLDARLPLSSQNPLVPSMLKEKPRLILLTKADLADPTINQKWIQYFAQQGFSALAIDAQSGRGVEQIFTEARKSLAHLFATRKKKGIQSEWIRAMIIGIPNVGKSSLINRMAKRAKTQTGNRPGVTKAKQWIRLKEKMELLDTPGILWPKFEEPIVGFRLAVSGAIKEEVFQKEEVALKFIAFLLKRYPTALCQRYRLTLQETEEPLAYLEAIAQKRGCLKKGGVVDYEKAAMVLLQDFRAGRLGRISLEEPRDWKDETT